MSGQTCPACGGTYLHVRRRGISDVRECASCGFGLLVNSKGRGDYWTGEVEEDCASAFWAGDKKMYYARALKLLKGLAPGRRLLDFGGGIGTFAAVAEIDGWDAVVYEPSRTAASVARKHLGDARVFGDLDEISDASFDVIALWCVIAHTTDPVALIAAVKSKLKPGGVVWITTPNYSFQKPYAVIRRLSGKPIDFARDDHVTHFTPRAVVAGLKMAGFGEIAFQYCGVTGHCAALASRARPLIWLKRVWNRAAHSVSAIGGPVLVSELQVTARACEQSE